MEKDIQKKIAVLSEIATQLRIAKNGKRSSVDVQIKRLIEEILFLNKEPGCFEVVETVNRNIPFYYMHYVDEIGLAESIEKVVEKLKLNVQ